MTQAFERLGRHRPVIREPTAIFQVAKMKAFERLVEIAHDLSLIPPASEGAPKLSGAKRQSTEGATGCYASGAFSWPSGIHVANTAHQLLSTS